MIGSRQQAVGSSEHEKGYIFYAKSLSLLNCLLPIRHDILLAISVLVEQGQ